MITLFETIEEKTQEVKPDSENNNKTPESIISETINNYLDFLFSK